MNVAWVNPYKPIEPLPHNCDVCHVNFQWSEESGYYLKMVDKGPAGYEEYFLICSNDCRERAEKEKLVDKFYTDKWKRST